jgi:hypothetical protein
LIHLVSDAHGCEKERGVPRCAEVDNEKKRRGGEADEGDGGVEDSFYVKPPAGAARDRRRLRVEYTNRKELI